MTVEKGGGAMTANGHSAVLALTVLAGSISALVFAADVLKKM